MSTENEGTKVVVGADISSFKQKMNEIKNKLKETATAVGTKIKETTDKIGKDLKNVSKNFNSIGKEMSKKVTAPIMAIGVGAIATSMNFEASMSKVKAITGATGESFKKLQDQAKQLGSSTQFSASQASEAMQYLGMAGFKTEEIMSAMPGMLDLASASGTDLATTADIVSDSLSAFSMEAGEAGHLADIMAKASSTANTDVVMLGESLKYCAPIAHAFGMSAEETTSALAIMANSGIKASQAGTTLRGALTRLAKPTKEVQEWVDKLGLSLTDSEGNMLPFNQILGQMREKFKGLTKEQQLQATTAIFGKQSMSGMLAVLNTSREKFDEYTKSLENSDGTSKKMAQTMNDNLKGAITKLKSALEGAGIIIGDVLAPTIKKLATTVNNLVDKFNSLDEGTQKTIVKIALLVAGIAPLLLIIGKTITGISNLSVALKTLNSLGLGKSIKSFASFTGSLIKNGVQYAITTAKTIAHTTALVAQKTAIIATSVATKAMTVAQTALNVVMNANPIMLVVTAIVALVAGLVVLYKKNEKVREIMQKCWQVLKSTVIASAKAIGDTAKQIFEGLVNLTEKVSSSIKNAWTKLGTLTSSTWSSIKSTIEQNGGGIKGVIITYIEAYKSIWSAGFSILDTITGGKLSSIVETVKNMGTKVKGFLKDMFTFEIPHIKLPHFDVKGKFSLNPPSVPNVGVNWYAKGGVFDGASVVGVGEDTGVKEAVIPLSGSHMKPFADTIAKLMGGGNGVNQNNYFYSPKALSPSETEQKFREVSREQAIEWGLG